MIPEAINMKYTATFSENGYAILDQIYTDTEIENMISCIETAASKNQLAESSKHLFAIRRVVEKIPQLKPIIFNTNLKTILQNVFQTDCFLTKAIYFDKPSASNWFVAYHQDLSISVTEKNTLPNYSNWTFKKGQYGVQPPIEILEDIVTVRIHLDHTTKENGALKVVPTSHTKGIYRPETIDRTKEKEAICEVQKGGVMLMKPLTLHASGKTTNHKKRRVLHLEFSTKLLDKPLQWLEFATIN